MNNKKAKALRRAAREQTIGMPNVAYSPDTKPVYVVNRDSLGIIESIKRSLPGVPRKLAQCTRSVYQQLKKNR